MASTDLSPDSVAKILHARMARSALLHVDNVDLRSGAALELAGLVNRVPNEPDDVTFVDVLNDAKHPRRSGALPGPILFYTEATEAQEKTTKQYAAEMRMFFLSSNVGLRGAAWRHFRLLADTFPEDLSRGLREELTDKFNALTSEEVSIWQPAGIHLYDRVDGDILCQIAGFRQSIAERYEDGLRYYLRQLLSPTLSGLGFLQSLVLAPTEQRERIRSVVQRIVTDAKSLSDACDAYVARLGMLPLAGDSSFLSMVSLWKQTRGEQRDAASEILDWSNDGSPLSRFYCCSYWLQNTNEFTSETHPRVWKTLCDVATVRDDDESLSDDAMFWGIARDLARHYLRHLELTLPGAGREPLSLSAWWLAHRVAEALHSKPAAARHLRDIALRPAASTSEIAWRFANPSSGSSLAAATTHWQVSPWLMSLVAVLGNDAAGILRGQVAEEDRKTLRLGIGGQLFAGGPTVGRRDANHVYLFETISAESLKRLELLFDDAELSAFIHSVDGMYGELMQPDIFLGRLRNIAEADEPNQLFVANAARMLAMRESLPLDGVWDLLSNAQWRTAAFRRLTLPTLESISMAMAASLLRGGDKWLSGLPHIYASACEEMEDDAERFETFFSITVVACMHTHSVSALERLLRGKQRGRLREIARNWKGQLQDPRYSGYPWVVARMRAVNAAMSVS